jgi:dolichol-phosphate mannosyltransferase
MATPTSNFRLKNLATAEGFDTSPRLEEPQDPGEPVSIVLPTLNEKGALIEFWPRLESALSSPPGQRVTEVVFVDDGSVDGTRELFDKFATRLPGVVVRSILRNQPMGSANAELVGIQAASNPLVVKLDSDGQHPPEIIPKLIEAATGATDLVVASRYLDGGGNLWAPTRGVISRSAKLIAQLLLPGARKVRDPISGYFLIRQTHAQGLDPALARYKLLLYLLATNRIQTVCEVPFWMRERSSGESKIVGRSMNYVLRYLIEVSRYWRVSHNSP